MVQVGYLKYNYGNDMFGDSALKRYERFHNCDSTWIFNTSVGGGADYGACGCGCGCNGGSWFGGGLRGLLGVGLGMLGAGAIWSVGRWIFNGGLKGLLGGGRTPDKATDKTDNDDKTKGYEAQIKSLQDLVAKLRSDIDALTAKGSKPSTEVTDKDYAQLTKFGERANKLIASKPDLADKDAVEKYNKAIDDLIKEIQDYKLIDDVQTSDNNKHKDNIISLLRAAKVTYVPTKPVDDQQGDLSADLNENDDDVEEQNPLSDDNSIKYNSDIQGGSGVDEANNFVDKYADKFQNWNTLSDDEKNRIIAEFQKIVDKLKGQKDRTALLDIVQDLRIPADLRKFGEQALYNEGYSNWDGNIDDLKKIGVDRAVDMGAPRDIAGSSKIEETGNGRVMITIHDNDLDQDVVYTMIDNNQSDTGEYIFKSLNGTGGTQYYVLQKNSEGKYVLMQYEYHTGYNAADRYGAY